MPAKRMRSERAKHSKLNTLTDRAHRTDRTSRDHHTSKTADVLRYLPSATKPQKGTHKVNTASSLPWCTNSRMVRCLKATPTIPIRLMDSKVKSINSVSTRTHAAEIDWLVCVMQRVKWLTISGSATCSVLHILVLCCSWSKMQLIP